jgi:Flp pilus assembly protein TadG
VRLTDLPTPAREHGRGPTGERRAEDGSLATPFLLVLLTSILLVTALVDAGAYLAAAARAQGAADAAALAAAAAEQIQPAPAHIVARSVAGRNGARVESCSCRAGTPRVEVEVSVPVGGLAVARLFGATRVAASAEALLVDDATPRVHDGAARDAAPGTTAGHPW